MKILANMRKAFGLALAFALALSLSAPAQGQSVLKAHVQNPVFEKLKKLSYLS